MAEVEPFRLYSVPETARIMGISEAAVRTLIANRRLGFVEISDGGNPRVTGQAIADFAATAANKVEEGET